MRKLLTSLVFVFSQLALPDVIHCQQSSERKEETMKTKHARIEELLKRYSTAFLREDLSLEESEQESDATFDALITLCSHDRDSLVYLLDKLENSLKIIDRVGAVDFYILREASSIITVLVWLDTNLLRVHYDRLKALAMKALEVRRKIQGEEELVDASLLQIVIYLEFQVTGSLDTFKRYMKATKPPLYRMNIFPKWVKEPKVAEFLNAQLDYLFEAMEHPNDDAWAISKAIRDRVREYDTERQFYDGWRPYFEEKLKKGSFLSRFTAAIVLLEVHDPCHQEALRVLLQTLDDHVYEMQGREYLDILQFEVTHPWREEISLEEYFSGNYVAPFWRRMPSAEARQMLAVLQKFIKHYYRPDLRESTESWSSGYAADITGALIQYHPELQKDASDLVPLLLDMLQEAANLNDPIHLNSSCRALAAIGGDATQQAIRLILQRLKGENRFNIQLIGNLGEYFGPAAKEAVPVLEQLFHETDDIYVKAHILESIRQITGSILVPLRPKLPSM